MNAHKSPKSNWFENQIEFYTENPFGAMAMLITLQSCVGSVAAALSLEKDHLEPLVLCAVITMMANAVCIAQAPARLCIWSLYISVIVNFLIILFISLS